MTTRVGNPKAENLGAEGVTHEQQACSAKAVVVGVDGTGRDLVMVEARRRWIAPVMGAGFLVAGLAESRRLRAGDATDARRSALTTVPVRLGIGTVLLAQPRLVPALLGVSGPTDARSAAPLLMRVFSVREIVLGVGTFAVARDRGDVRPWLLTLSLIDTGEALVLLDAVRRRWVPAHRGLAFILPDVGSAAAGLGLMAQLRRDRMS